MPRRKSKAAPSSSNVTAETKKEFFDKALDAIRDFDEAMEAAKSAQSVYRGVLKAAKKAGVDQKAIARALADRKLDRDEVVARERDYLEMLEISKVVPEVFARIQTSLFPGLVPEVDMTVAPSPDRAYDAGHLCGSKAEDRKLNPHNAGTEEYDAWDRGWLLGQSQIIEKMPSAKAARKKKAKNADFLPPPVDGVITVDDPLGIEDMPAAPDLEEY